jgi:hypothetical protein
MEPDKWAAEYFARHLNKQAKRLEYQQWQEEYRQLVFAKEVKVDNSKPMISRRAKRRQRNKAK